MENTPQSRTARWANEAEERLADPDLPLKERVAQERLIKVIEATHELCRQSLANLEKWMEFDEE